VIVGTDGRTEFQLDLDTGTVVSVDPASSLPPRFVNSSIQRLAVTLAAYASYAASVRVLESDEGARRLVRATRDQMRALDPPAVDGPETWWSVIMEQADEGLL
jgi:hypothetical protein